VKARGKAMGFAYLGIGVGGATVPWISRFLVDRFGWQVALKALGVLIVIIALPFAALVKDAPASGVATKSRAFSDLKRAFKSFPFVLLLLGSMCSVGAVSGTQQSLTLFLGLDLHYTQREAATVLSLVLGFSIVGRLLMGWLADRFAKKYVMLLIYLLVVVAIPLIFMSARPMMRSVAAALFGIALGGDYMIIPLMTAEIFGVEILGRLMGVLLTAGSVAEALAPWWVGHLRDTSGSYGLACVVLVGMALLGAVAVMFLPETRSDG